MGLLDEVCMVIYRTRRERNGPLLLCGGVHSTPVRLPGLPVLGSQCQMRMCVMSGFMTPNPLYPAQSRVQLALSRHSGRVSEEPGRLRFEQLVELHCGCQLERQEF